MKKTLAVSALCVAAATLVWGIGTSQVNIHHTSPLTPIVSQPSENSSHQLPAMADGGGWPPCCRVVVADGGGWPPTHPATGNTQL